MAADDDDDDFMPFEDYMEMSDAETDALLNSLCNQHNEMIACMTPLQYYRYRRASGLDLCVRQRRIAKTFPELFMPRLRESQKRLLALRIEHRTGVAVGHS